MSLIKALDSAVSSLNVRQEQIGIASQNIANADNKDYDKREVALANNGYGGVLVSAIQSKFDSFTKEKILSLNPVLEGASITHEYYKDIDVMLGNPAKGEGISFDMNDLFISLNNLVTDPSNNAVKGKLITDLSQVTKSFTKISSDIETLNDRAFKDIDIEISEINTSLDLIFSIQKSINNIPQENRNTNSYLDLKQKQEVEIVKLSKKLDINVLEQENSLIISTGSGALLVNTSGERYQLRYDATSSPDQIMIMNHTPSGEFYDYDKIITKDSNGVNFLADGKLRSLFELKDNILPAVIEQYNNLASELIDEFNMLHNIGTPYPPNSQLTGTNLLDITKDISMNGKITIAAMNNVGDPLLTNNYSGNVMPVTLDLGKLDGGNGPGQFNLQTLVDEINQYYTPGIRTELGNLHDIKLASRSATATAGGNITFDFDLINRSDSNAKFTLNNISIVSGGGSLVSPVMPLVTNMASGDMGRTGDDLSVTMNLGGGGGPYTIRANISVDDGNGNISTSEIDYVFMIPVPAETLNTRYTASSIASGSATNVAPVNTSPPIVASILNEDGSPYSGGGKGVLSLKGDSSIDARIGLLDNAVQESVTNRKFSHFFGLNNLFTASDSANVIKDIQVRQDIYNQPALFAGGQIIKTDQANANHTYEIGISSKTILSQMEQLQHKDLVFDETVSLPTTKTSFIQYAGFISEHVSYQILNARTLEEITQSSIDVYKEIDNDISAVNLDEELANIASTQHIYGASAKMVEVVKSLFDDFMAVI